jgi:long-subunit fatty acid transport protein
MHLPASFTVGVSYGKGVNWSVGTEFGFQDWASFKDITAEDDMLGKAWRASLGGEYTMDPLALESYLKRVTFRTGVNYQQYPFLANGKPVKDFGINFGFSFPQVVQAWI